MTTFRAFIAVDLSPEIRTEIEALIARLRRMPGQAGMRFVSASGIHLTLKFLGDIPAELGDLLHQALERATAARSAFSVRVRGAGCFPDAGRPRVVWVGLEEPRGELSALQRAIEAECVALGLPAEDRPFSPHLTLGRVRREAGAETGSFVRSMLEREQAVDLGVMTVELGSPLSERPASNGRRVSSAAFGRAGGRTVSPDIRRPMVVILGARRASADELQAERSRRQADGGCQEPLPVPAAIRAAAPYERHTRGP